MRRFMELSFQIAALGPRKAVYLCSDSMIGDLTRGNTYEPVCSAHMQIETKCSVVPSLAVPPTSIADFQVNKRLDSTVVYGWLIKRGCAKGLQDKVPWVR